jgi:Transposase
MKNIRFVGLDVHAETIAVAVAGPNEEVRSLGTIPNREESIRKLVRKVGPAEQLRACREAGPTGYVLYWQLTALGVECDVVSPMLIPVKSGDRVKTDRRDAEKLARCHRAGDLTPVCGPDAAHEALRDLSARQLPTNDEHAVPTREYQIDQSSRCSPRSPPVPLAPYPCKVKVTAKTKTPAAIFRNVLDNVSHIRSITSEPIVLRADRPRSR